MTETTEIPPSRPSDTGGPYQVKLKGLPYESSSIEIQQFLLDCICAGEGGIKILMGEDGRPSGEALVVLASYDDLLKALSHDRQHLGSRYIEVVDLSKEQYDLQMNTQPITSSGGDHIVRLRGLPYSAQLKDIVCLLSDCKIVNGEKGVKFTFSHDGRPSGEAFVELCSAEDVEKALAHNHENMGRRYVEIFRANKSQLDWDCRKDEKTNSSGEGSGVVRLRGLPFGCTEEQVVTFFTGLSIIHGGITIQRDTDGRESGEAFVEFASKGDIDKALARDRNEIQHRYIEVFRSSHSEVKPFKGGRPTPYSRPRGGGYSGYGTFGGGGEKFGSGYERNYRGGRGRGGGRGGGYGYGGDGGFYEDPSGYYHGPPPQHAGPPHVSSHGGAPHEDPNLIAYPPIRQPHASRGGFGAAPGNGIVMSGPPASRHSVRLRGLPYSAKEKDIADFFSPLVPLKISMDLDQYGRPSGEGEVYFSTPDEAKQAMQKNNQNIGPRYIELFLNSPGEAAAPQHVAASVPQYGAPPQQATWQAPAPLVSGGTTAGYSSGGAASYTPGYGSQQASVGYQQPPAQQYQQTTGYVPASVGYQPAATAGYQPASDTSGYVQAAPVPQQWGSTY